VFSFWLARLRIEELSRRYEAKSRSPCLAKLGAFSKRLARMYLEYITMTEIRQPGILERFKNAF
jgi:hypothetical protein